MNLITSSFKALLLVFAIGAVTSIFVSSDAQAAGYANHENSEAIYNLARMLGIIVMFVILRSIFFPRKKKTS